MRVSALLPTSIAAAVVLLAGCTTSGTSAGGAESPAPSSPSASVTSPAPSSAPASRPPTSTPPVATPTRPPTTPDHGNPGPVGDGVRGIVSAGGAARGPLEKISTALTSAAAVQTYADKLAPSLRKEFLPEAASLMKQVPKGQYLHVQTVYDGCDTPSATTITAHPTSGGIALTVKPPAKTTKECFTAERSVAFLSLAKMVG